MEHALLVKKEVSGYLQIVADVNTEIEAGIWKKAKNAFHTDT